MDILYLASRKSISATFTWYGAGSVQTILSSITTRLSRYAAQPYRVYSGRWRLELGDSDTTATRWVTARLTPTLPPCFAYQKTTERSPDVDVGAAGGYGLNYGTARRMMASRAP